MEICHICIYLLLNRGKVFMHANIAKDKEKRWKDEEMKWSCTMGKFRKIKKERSRACTKGFDKDKISTHIYQENIKF